MAAAKNKVINVKLQDLKSLSYSEYLKTEHWYNIREIVKKNAKNKCQLCGKTTGEMHTHHNTYEHLGQEQNYIEDVILLCKSCHYRYHHEIDIIKREQEEYNRGRYEQFLDIINNLELEFQRDHGNNSPIIPSGKGHKTRSDGIEINDIKKEMFNRYQNEKRKNIEPNGSAYIGQVLFLGSMKKSKIRGGKYFDFITEKGNVFLHTKTDLPSLKRVQRAKKYVVHKIDKTKTIEEMRRAVIQNKSKLT